MDQQYIDEILSTLSDQQIVEKLNALNALYERFMEASKNPESEYHYLITPEGLYGALAENGLLTRKMEEDYNSKDPSQDVFDMDSHSNRIVENFQLNYQSLSNTLQKNIYFEDLLPTLSVPQLQQKLEALRILRNEYVSAVETAKELKKQLGEDAEIHMEILTNDGIYKRLREIGLVKAEIRVDNANECLQKTFLKHYSKLYSEIEHGIKALGNKVQPLALQNGIIEYRLPMMTLKELEGAQCLIDDFRAKIYANPDIIKGRNEMKEFITEMDRFGLASNDVMNCYINGGDSKGLLSALERTKNVIDKEAQPLRRKLEELTPISGMKKGLQSGSLFGVAYGFMSARNNARKAPDDPRIVDSYTPPQRQGGRKSLLPWWGYILMGVTMTPFAPIALLIGEALYSTITIPSAKRQPALTAASRLTPTEAYLQSFQSGKYKSAQLNESYGKDGPGREAYRQGLVDKNEQSRIRAEKNVQSRGQDQYNKQFAGQGYQRK